MNRNLIVLMLFSIVGLCLASPNICSEMGFYTVHNPKSCTKFYVCINGQMLHQECAPGLSFDREQGGCNLNEATRCNLELCPIDTIGVVSMVANPDDCKKYYACTRGVATQMQCAGNLLFNPRIRTCDLPENVQCATHNEPTIFNCPQKGVLKVPHPEICEKYYLCMNGIRAEYKCAEGLVFDSRRKRCNFKEISTCFKPKFGEGEEGEEFQE